MANLSFPRSKDQIIEAVKLYLDKVNLKVEAFNDSRPGISWFYGFLCRHPEMKKTEKLEQACAMPCTKESVYAWFGESEQFKIENNIASEDQVFNCGKCGFPLQAGFSMKVLCNKHCRCNFQIMSSCKASITTLQCICAKGTVIPSSAFS